MSFTDDTKQNNASSRIIKKPGVAGKSGLELYPRELYFGALVVGEDQLIRTFSVTNVGDRTLRIENIEIQQESDQFILLGSFPELVRPGDAFDVGVKYQSDQLGLKVGTVVITTNEEEYYLGVSGRVIGSLYIEQMNNGFLALIQQEQTARADADSAEAASRLLMQAQLEDSFAAQLEEERFARVTYFDAEVVARQQLSVTLNDLVMAQIDIERQARVDGDSAEASAREALVATVTDELNTALSSGSAIVEAARVAAELAQTSAEASATLASTYKDDAAASATAADGAKTLANDYMSTAETYKNLSASYASDAADDAYEAANSATVAENEKVLANSERTMAEIAKNLSALYRDESLGFRNAAQTQAGLAESARVDADASKASASASSTLSASYRDQSQGFRNEAEGFKNTAQTQAGIATTAKVNAEAAKSSAETASTLSATYRDQSQGYRNEAEGFKNTATTQAGLAATAKVNAEAAQASAETAQRLTAEIVAKTIPYDFVEDGYYWFSGYNGQPKDVGPLLPNSEWSFVDVANVGRVIQLTTSAQRDLGSKGGIPLIPGRRYRVTARVRQTAGATGTVMNLYRIGIQGAGSVSNASANQTIAALNTWYEWSGEFTADTLLAAGATMVRVMLRKGATGAAVTLQYAFVKLEDISVENNLQAQLDVQSGAIATAEGKLSAYWQVTAVAGGRAKLKVYADSNGGGGVDIEGDTRISGNLIVDGTIVNSKLPNTVIDQPKLAASGKGQAVIRTPFGPSSPYFFGDQVGGEILLDSYNLIVSYPVWVMISIGMTYEILSGTFSSTTDSKAWTKIWNNTTNALHATNDQMKWANSSPGGDVGSGNSNSRVDFVSLPAGNWDIRMCYATNNNTGRFFAGWNNFNILWGPL